MKGLLLTIILSCCLSAYSQQGLFPSDWVGNWSGTLQWYSGTNEQAKTVRMQLQIQPVPDSPLVYTWKLFYGEDAKDQRPYLLRAVDTAKRHWLIDERNSILLDQFIIGDRLIGSFSLNNTLITNSYWIENGEMQIEFTSLRKSSLRSSGMGTEDIPRVEAYQVVSFQRARLKRL